MPSATGRSSVVPSQMCIPAVKTLGQVSGARPLTQDSFSLPRVLCLPRGLRVSHEGQSAHP